ncbi:MAG: PQQ-binding-like beta-propeller repeat protein [Bacteriovoracaceae bacterium]
MKKTLSLVSLFVFLMSCSMVEQTLDTPDRKHTFQKKDEFRIAWSRNLDPVYDTGNFPIALNSPNVHKGILFVGTGDGFLEAFELENGRPIWKIKENGHFHQKPIFHKDTIIYGTVEGRVVARHYLSGKLKYKVDLDTAIESPGVIAGGRLFFQLRNHKVFSLDAETGKILWAYRRSVPYLTTIQRVSTPLVVGKKLYVGFADANIVCFNVEDGSLVWERKLSRGLKFVDVDASPVLFRNRLITGSMDGKVSILNPKNGVVLRTLDFAISRAPVIHEGKLYFGTTDGRLIRFEADLTTSKELSVSKRALGDIAFTKELLYLATLDGRLLEVDPSSLSVKRTHEFGHDQSAIFGDLVSFDDKLALLSSRYRLYILDL